jgi:hypothetical protein
MTRRRGVMKWRISGMHLENLEVSQIWLGSEVGGGE